MAIQETKIQSNIIKIMGLIGSISKSNTNKTQGYKFRGIDDLYNALNKHLAEVGVFITSDVLNVQREEKTSKNGGLLIYSIITMKFKFIAEDGSFVESTTIGEAMDSGDKSMNKAMSTAYKYALMQIFCIPTEEPKDSEVDTYEVKPKTTEGKDNRLYLLTKAVENIEKMTGDPTINTSVIIEKVKQGLVMTKGYPELEQRLNSILPND